MSQEVQPMASAFRPEATTERPYCCELSTHEQLITYQLLDMSFEWND